MILFYFTQQYHRDCVVDSFQFHYDLILFYIDSNDLAEIKQFQFHYDLILF